MSLAENMGLPYQENEHPSNTRLNATTVMWGTGNQIQALGPTQVWPGKPVFCTQNSTDGTLVRDVFYQRNTALNQWMPISNRRHTHSADTDVSGGLLTDILSANSIVDASVDKRHARAASYNVRIAGSGDVQDDAAHGDIRVRTNSTVNSSAAITDGGIRQWWNRKIRLVMKTDFDGNTSQVLLRSGINVEDVVEVVENSNKIGIEGCDATGINFQIVTASGTSRTTIGSTYGLDPGTPSSYRLDYIPAASLTLTFNGSTFVTKTSNIPSSGATPSENIFRLAVKSTDTNGKNYNIWGMFIAAQASDAFD